MKISNFLFFFTILSLFSIANGMSHQEYLDQYLDKMKKGMNDQEYQSYSKKSHLLKRPIGKKDILQLLLSCLVPTYYTFIPHEFGHALGSKYFYKSPIDIHIGAQGDYQLDYLLKIGSIKFHTFSLLNGGFAYSIRGKDKIKDSIISAAGPIFAILTSILIKKIINKFHDKVRHNIYLDILFEFYSEICFIDILNGITQGFTPLQGRESDGYKIWKNLGINEKYLNIISRYQIMNLLIMIGVTYYRNFYLTK